MVAKCFRHGQCISGTRFYISFILNILNLNGCLITDSHSTSLRLEMVSLWVLRSLQSFEETQRQKTKPEFPFHSFLPWCSQVSGSQASAALLPSFTVACCSKRPSSDVPLLPHPFRSTLRGPPKVFKWPVNTQCLTQMQPSGPGGGDRELDRMTWEQSYSSREQCGGQAENLVCSEGSDQGFSRARSPEISVKQHWSHVCTWTGWFSGWSHSCFLH